MARFGPKDKDVPSLTSFYQLEFDDNSLVGSELDQWMWTQQIGHSMSGFINQASQKANLWSEFYYKGDELLPSIAHLQQLLRCVMDAVADNTAASEADEKEINDLFSFYLSSPSISWSRSEKGWQEDSKTNFRPVIAGFKRLPANNLVTDFFFQALLGSFFWAVSPNKFKRCQECRSVYIELNPRQVFCSNRCNSRAKTRRFRAREKESSLLP